MRILFMGTPEFSVPCLEKLISLYDVVAVVTQPDKPKGRGYIMTPSPVKLCAVSHSIPVYQPQTLKNEAFFKELHEIAPDAIVVVAYGKLLPPYILGYPKLGCINVHGSLLPEYRGAAPMQRAIIDGKTETGVTTMLMAEGMDTGDMLEKAVLPICPDDNFEAVHDKLSSAGAELIASTLDKLTKGLIKPVSQNNELATTAPKIEKADCALDFDMPVKSIYNKIRGLSPFPLAYTHLNGKQIKIISACIASSDAPHNSAPGEVISLKDGKIFIACHDGVLAVCSLLPEGKSRMNAADFIRGRKISVGELFKTEILQ